MYKYVILQTSGGYQIYVNLILSSAGKYLSRQPYVINLIKEVLAPIDLNKSDLSLEFDLGRVIGNTDIIETTEKDTIFYAQPIKKEVFSRYAKNRSPSPSQKLSIIMKADSEGNFELVDTWIGPYMPPFPGDSLETAKSKPYWLSHALVQDAQTVQTKTITKICPY
jgi:hypothetical protein